MTRFRSHALLSIIALGIATAAQAQGPDKPLAVFVTTAPLTFTGDPASHRAALADAKRARKALERSVEAQHGNKRARWPADAEERYRTAEEAVAAAVVPTLYGEASQADLADSIVDIANAVTGAGIRGRREHVVLVGAAADAHLIVELKARRSARGSGLLIRHYFVLYTIKPGPKVASDRFAAMPRANRPDAFIPRSSAVEAKEWLGEAFGNGSWKLAGAILASAVDDFAKTHAALLTQSAAGVVEPRTPPPSR